MTRRTKNDTTVPASSRWPVVPQLTLKFGQRYRTKRVREALVVVERVCDEMGGAIGRIIESRRDDAWSTSITVESKEVICFRDAGRVWWTALRHRLARDVPHQELLTSPLAEASYSFTTPVSAELAEGISDVFARHARERQDRDLSRG